MLQSPWNSPTGNRIRIGSFPELEDGDWRVQEREAGLGCVGRGHPSRESYSSSVSVSEPTSHQYLCCTRSWFDQSRRPMRKTLHRRGDRMSQRRINNWFVLTMRRG